MQEVVFQASGRDLRTQADADGLARKGLNLLAERRLEHWLHAGSAAHATGFVQGDVVELDGWWLLGHQVSRFLRGGLEVVHGTREERDLWEATAAAARAV
jgi:hypothetical protein